MKYYFDQHIGIFENALSDEMCDSIVASFEKDTTNKKSRKNIGTKSHVTKDTFSTLFQHDEELCKEFCNIFWKDLYPLYEYDFHLETFRDSLYLDDFKIQKTKPTEGFHWWHCEYSDFSLNRFGVYSVFLNDVEEGGETEFLFQSKRISPKKGTVCIFPSSYTHTHRGNPPLNSNKYLMTGWLSLIIPIENPPYGYNVIHYPEQLYRNYLNNE